MSYKIIESNNINEARREIDKISKINRDIKVIVKAGSDEFNRKIVESSKVNFIVDFEFNPGRDRLKERSSGLNQVLCKILRARDVWVGIDIRRIIGLSDKDKILILGRLMQNIKLCNKYKVKMVAFNSGNISDRDLLSFLLSLGMSTNMADYAVKNRIDL